MITLSHTIVKPRFAGFVGLQDFPRICGGSQEIQMAKGIFRGAFFLGGGGAGGFTALGVPRNLFFSRNVFRQINGRPLAKSWISLSLWDQWLVAK